MIFRSLLALFVLVSFVSSETLEQEYYGINVPAGENTALPPGNTQALRMRGVGVQVGFFSFRSPPQLPSQQFLLFFS